MSALNKVTDKSEVVKAFMMIPDFSDNQLKRLSGGERKLIAKMEAYLQYKQPKYAPDASKLAKLRNHITDIKLAPDKKVSWITAIFRDCVRSKKKIKSDIEEGRLLAQKCLKEEEVNAARILELENNSAKELVAEDLFSKANKPSDPTDNESVNAFAELGKLAESGDGYAIYYLKKIFHERGLYNGLIDLDGLYKTALQNNHPKIVEDNLHDWAKCGAGRMLNEILKITENEVKQFFDLPAHILGDENNRINMTRVCYMVISNDDKITLGSATHKQIVEYLDINEPSWSQNLEFYKCS